MEEQNVIRAMAALAHAHRLKVFRALVVAGQAGMTPGTIASANMRPASRDRSVASNSARTSGVPRSRWYEEVRVSARCFEIHLIVGDT